MTEGYVPGIPNRISKETRRSVKPVRFRPGTIHQLY